MGDLDSWVTAVTAVTLPMPDTEVCVFSSAWAAHRETLPLLEKQLLKKPPPSRDTAAHCPCFPSPVLGCRPGFSQIQLVGAVCAWAQKSQFQDNFLAIGMLARWGNALCCAGGAAWPGAVELSRQARVGMEKLQGWAEVVLPHFGPSYVECQVHKSEQWNSFSSQCPAISVTCGHPWPWPRSGRALFNPHQNLFRAPTSCLTRKCQEKHETPCAGALGLFH